MGTLSVYLKMNFNIPISRLADVFPPKVHIDKLIVLPCLFNGATTRTIEPDIRADSFLAGYTLTDQVFYNGEDYRKNIPYNNKREMKSFSARELSD